MTYPNYDRIMQDVVATLGAMLSGAELSTDLHDTQGYRLKFYDRSDDSWELVAVELDNINPGDRVSHDLVALFTNPSIWVTINSNGHSLTTGDVVYGEFDFHPHLSLKYGRKPVFKVSRVVSKKQKTKSNGESQKPKLELTRQATAKMTVKKFKSIAESAVNGNSDSLDKLVAYCCQYSGVTCEASPDSSPTIRTSEMRAAYEVIKIQEKESIPLTKTKELVHMFLKINEHLYGWARPEAIINVLDSLGLVAGE